ncbi:hypothetical protein FACS189475_04580 [Betaproteobacteria bacterium]|nr:hypothetical protein FACS189475_04580 [Betaproteobacteria bacterium]
MSARFKLTRPEPREADIQSAILQALNVHPSVAWAERMNSGAGRLMYPGGKASQFIKFGFPGCPDVLGQLRDGRLLAIEVKRPSGKVSPEQQVFIEKASKHGAVAFVARSVSDVWEALDGARFTFPAGGRKRGAGAARDAQTVWKALDNTKENHD